MSFLWHKFWEEDGRFVWLESNPDTTSAEDVRHEKADQEEEEKDIADGIEDGFSDTDELQKSYESRINKTSADVQEMIVFLEGFNSGEAIIFEDKLNALWEEFMDKNLADQKESDDQ
ncbi:hypothetical protein KJ891_02725, partial [Candidatus Micrarchaeota archaeon]|nr:hypothetical protein [Candidatus Micrarchaeota archaeon]